ncbi:MAG: hypothetical protein HYU36_25295 [Planctomycetes bacterium]|nr:hypothetical protein [Planctomycetota bacterium]
MPSSRLLILLFASWISDRDGFGQMKPPEMVEEARNYAKKTVCDLNGFPKISGGMLQNITLSLIKLLDSDQAEIRSAVAEEMIYLKLGLYPPPDQKINALTDTGLSKEKMCWTVLILRRFSRGAEISSTSSDMLLPLLRDAVNCEVCPHFFSELSVELGNLHAHAMSKVPYRPFPSGKAFEEQLLKEINRVLLGRRMLAVIGTLERQDLGRDKRDKADFMRQVFVFAFFLLAQDNQLDRITDWYATEPNAAARKIVVSDGLDWPTILAEHPRAREILDLASKDLDEQIAQAARKILERVK